jgi:hypothetical protein
LTAASSSAAALFSNSILLSYIFTLRRYLLGLPQAVLGEDLSQAALGWELIRWIFPVTPIPDN